MEIPHASVQQPFAVDAIGFPHDSAIASPHSPVQRPFIEDAAESPHSPVRGPFIADAVKMTLLDRIERYQGPQRPPAPQGLLANDTYTHRSSQRRGPRFREAVQNRSGNGND